MEIYGGTDYSMKINISNKQILLCPYCKKDILELPNFKKQGNKYYCVSCGADITKIKLEQLIEIIKSNG